MSNEELVGLIQSGQRDRLMELWQQVRRMALKEAVRWAAYRSNGVELEDLAQASFIALMRAVDSFDLTAGCRFSTWYYPVMKDEFQRAAGCKSVKRQRDPLNSAVSLDTPLTADDLTLGDAILDEQAEAAFWNAEYQEDMRRLRPLLLAAVDALPKCQRNAVLARYWDKEPVANQAQNLRLAMRALRHPSVTKQLRAFL